MKRRALCLLMSLILLGGILPQAFGAEECQRVEVTLDGEFAEGVAALMYGWTSYLPLDQAMALLRPDATVAGENGTFQATAEDFSMTATVGACYVAINGRYLYVADQVKEASATGSAENVRRAISSAPAIVRTTEDETHRLDGNNVDMSQEQIDQIGRAHV